MSEQETTAEPQISLIIDGGIAWIVLSNPDRMNALTAQMWADLPLRIAAADADPNVRLIVIRGSGERAFCAGADISEFETARSGDSAVHYNKLNDEAFSAVSRAVKPTIAMIHGYCMGGGLAIAACCDLRFADEAVKVAIPAAKLGLGYNADWIPPLLALAGPAQIKELVFTGRRFGAEDAQRMGLVNRVVPSAELDSLVRSYADEIAANAPLTIRAAKLAIDEVWARPENPDRATLAAAVQGCFDSEDYIEGRRAFLEKRKPVFQGK